MAGLERSETSSEEMKQAWGLEPGAGIVLSPAAGTLAGMQRLSSTPIDIPPPGPALAISKRQARTTRSPHGSWNDDSSSSDGSISSVRDKSESDTTPAVHTPMGVAPPPPLRNIPHQTPENSPTTSQLFTSPPRGQVMHPQFRLPQPSVHQHSTPRVPTIRSISGPNHSKPPTVNSHHSTDDSENLAPANHLKPYPARMSIDISDLPKIILPNNKVVSSSDANSRSDPVLTSTPKAKPTLFQASSGIAATKAAKPASQRLNFALGLKDDGSVGENQEHKSAVISVPRNNETVTRPLNINNSATSSGTNKDASRGDEPTTVPAVGAKNTVQTSPLITSQNSPVGDNSALNASPPSRRKPPRTPSQLLQRNLSQRSSSSQSSDSEDLSSSESDASVKNEERDKFDSNAVMQQRGLPTRIGQRFFVGVLPPLSVTAPRNLPPIVRGVATTSPPPLQDRLISSFSYSSSLGHTHTLPSYQEASVTPRRRATIASTPPAYLSSGSREYGQRGSADIQDISNHPIHLAAMEGVGGSQMKTLALQYGVDYRDIGGRTPLMYAVLGNQPKMLELLLKFKASVNAKDMTGLTALLWATYQANADALRVLMKNGADVHHVDQDGRTAFHWAMKTPNVHCLKWLCKFANIPEVINQPDYDGLTPLHWAVMSDQAAHVKMFLYQTKPDVSALDSDGRAPLNYAVLNFSPACIRAILDYHESAVNLTDAKNRTVLHYACAEGSADSVRTLLSYQKCNIHCTDTNGTTPLHWAAAANQPGLVQLLLRRGADRGQRDNNDSTPLDYAEQKGHVDCVKILRSYGLQRPGSAISLASRVSVSFASDAPSLDEHGHVIFRRFQRQFSLSGDAMSSIARLPADGQAQSEGYTEGHGGQGETQSREERGERRGEQVGRTGEQREENQEARGDQGETRVQEGVEQEQVQDNDSREHTRTLTSQSSQQEQHSVNEMESVRNERSGWKSLFCSGCCAKRTSTVTPL